MKTFSATIDNRTRDLPPCSAVPQPTAAPRALLIKNRKEFVSLPAAESSNSTQYT